MTSDCPKGGGWIPSTRERKGTTHRSYRATFPGVVAGDFRTRFLRNQRIAPRLLKKKIVSTRYPAARTFSDASDFE